jgi:SAM-dependent methyltransferase
MLTAEFLPREFKGKFDLIVSHIALEYAVLPNLALKNISQSLSPGGKAYVDWRAGRRDSREMHSPLAKFFASYKKSVPSNEAKELVRWGMSHWGREQVTPEQAEKAIKEGFEQYKVDAGQTMAWCNQLASLQKDPKLTIKILYTMPSPFGYIPAGLSIEKK